MTKRDGKYRGSVGEHYVLYKLIRECKDVNAVLATPNTDTVDIHAADKAGKPFAVQVKTKANSHKWFLTAKHEDIEDPGLFYAFVDLGWDFDAEKPKNDPPDIKCPPEVFIVPSEVVARAVHVSHQAWLNAPRKPGTSRKDGDRRDIYNTYPPRFDKVKGFPAGWMEEYRERWDLLC